MSPRLGQGTGVQMPGRGDGKTGRPALWVTHEVEDFAPNGVTDWPDGGGYPRGFLEWAYRTVECTDPTRVLHLCAGGVKVGTTVDIRPETKPTIVADARNVPLPDASFQWCMIDPPYSEEYATNLYGVSYPNPSQLLREAARLVQPGGRIGFLHTQVPLWRSVPVRLLRVHGITTGPGYAIRAWTVFERQQEGLGL